MTSDPVVPKGDGALVGLRVSPNAKRTEPRGLHRNTALKLKVSAPPADVRMVRDISGGDETVLVDSVGAERMREVLAPRPG